MPKILNTNNWNLQKASLLGGSDYVWVYRNLHTECSFSVKQDRVRFHSAMFVLKYPQFVVQKAGAERMEREGRRNVHAFVRGFIGPWTETDQSASQVFYYNKAWRLGSLDSDQIVTEAKMAWCYSGGVWVTF